MSCEDVLVAQNGMKRESAQTHRCVHNLYGQPCCDSSRICDLQQMCHLFPPTNSFLFSALMVRAHYLFHRARQASSGDRAVPVWPQQPCHQRQHTCQSECCIMATHHVDNTVCVTAVTEQVMSKLWQPMDIVFPRLHV